MANTILLKRKTTAGAPALADLSIGEVCLVIPDSALYWKKDAATLVGPYLATSSASWGSITGTLSSQTDLNNALGLKAPLASPELTGTPTAPTAAVDTDTTQIATTAFAKKEADDAQAYAIQRTNHTGSQAISTVTNLQAALDAKAPLASPALTGVPTAPTAAADTNTTQIATTAFAKKEADDAQAYAIQRANHTGTQAISTVTGLQGALDLKAPLASPALTGTPTAPTASGGTNTTQLATTAFVQSAITSLINGAPGVLDTLQELAAALGDDPNFAATMTSQLASKISFSDTIDGGTIS